MRTCLSIAALLIGVVPVLAQPSTPRVSVDGRWSGYLGCWQQLEESVRGEADAEPQEVPTKGIVVCVTPAANPAAVTMTTVVEKQTALDEVIVADGSSRAIDQPGCTGAQRARWSANGRRLFAHADLACSDGSKRSIAGLTTLAPGPTWVDIQVVTSGGRESIRVRRYRRAADQSAVRSRLSADQLATAASDAARQSAAFTVEEVKEASTRVTPTVVEAALVETRASFPLNAKRLQDLDAAGVPERVIDLMIALSFPDRFVVERSTPAPRSYGLSGGIDSFGWLDAGYDGFPYYYAPFGYGMWGRCDSYYYGAPVYAVEMVNEGIQPSGSGRVVDGQGYTRVRARAPEPGGVAGGSGFGGDSATGGSSSGGGVTSQGYSGGGGDSGRTAVARPPG